MKSLILLLFIVPTIICEEDICGGTYRGFQYTIASPNYPHEYPNDSNCVYVLQGEETKECEQEFHLQFLDFNLRASENCKGDHLQVGEKNVFCGYTVGLRKFHGINNTLTVVFHSDHKDIARGFKILVTAVPCTLKLNPLKNQSVKAITGEGRSKFIGNDIFGTYYRRIRGDNSESDATRISLLPKDISSPTSEDSVVRRPEIDFSPEDNSVIKKEPSGTIQKQDAARITSYLFLPPNETERNTFTTHITKDKVFDTVTSPSNELLPPSNNPPAIFSRVQFPKGQQLPSPASDKSSSTGQVQRVAIPARSYGEPGIGVVDYEYQVGNDCDKNIGVIGGQAIGSDKGNYDPALGQGSFGGNFGSSSDLIYDPKLGFATAGNNYPGGYNPGYPGGYYPGGIDNPSINYPGGIYNPSLGGGYNPSLGGGYNPSLGGGYNPSLGGGYNPSLGGGYNPSLGGGYNPSGVFPNYPTGGYGTSYPNGGVSPGYNPGYNPVIPNYNPGLNPIDPGLNPSLGGNYYPNAGSSWGNGYIQQNGECCRVPTARRFSIVSPGFPGGLSSNNGYSCRYTITKSSPDVCQLTLNFRFFNFGNEDPYCSTAYVEVDGRRFCGCKTGQNVQLSFPDYIGKNIFVYNTGNQRTRFSGFLIDVIQEPCAGGAGPYPPYQSYGSYNPYNTAGQIYPNYPSYIQRRSVESNSTIEKHVSPRSVEPSVISPSPVDPNPHIRNKRDLGYAYPKPNLPFLNKDSPAIPPFNGGKTHERIFGGSCQNRVFFDWAIASKEAFFKNARCGGVGIPGFNARLGASPLGNGRPAKSAPGDC